MDNDTRGRLFQEYSELHQRIKRLQSFILTPKFDELSDVDRADLRAQLGHMNAYFAVLARRTSRECN